MYRGNDARFIGHEPCPKCGSRDNLGRWEDHAYCFGCGYVETTKPRRPRPLEEGKQLGNGLPWDCTPELSVIAERWLRQYGITSKEIQENEFVWSESRKMLIVVIRDSAHNIKLWQGRNFGEGTKYYTRGDAGKVMHQIGAGDTLILVEDMVSCIKVGRQFASMPMLGSGMALKPLQSLSVKFKALRVWNDKDKLDESRRTARKALMAGFSDVGVISTLLDPKELSDTEIAKEVLANES